MSAAPVQEPQLEAKKDEAVVVVGSGGKGRLSKTNSGPSSGDKDRKLGGEEEGEPARPTTTTTRTVISGQIGLSRL